MVIIHKSFRLLLRLKKSFFIKIKRAQCLLLGNISLAKDCIIEPKANLIIDHPTKGKEPVIKIGKGTNIKNDSYICPRSGFIKIGESCSVNPFCILLGYGGITIGNQVRIASHTSIIAFNHNFFDTKKTIHKQGYNTKGIRIDDNVWIGSGCRILDGVRIGEGAIIGAGSVVTKDIPTNSIAAGVPAKVIKQRK